MTNATQQEVRRICEIGKFAGPEDRLVRAAELPSRGVVAGSI
jgi:hypothetical protein